MRYISKVKQIKHMQNKLQVGRMITLQSAAAAYRKLGHRVTINRMGIFFDRQMMTDKEFLIMAMSDFQVA